MSHPRLSLVLDAPDALPPEGRIALFRPRAETDLSDLPRDRVQAVQGFKPDHDALAARGLSVSPAPEGSYAAAVVFVPRAKAEARALLAEACRHVTAGGVIWVDGGKTDGIDSLYKDLRKLVPVSAATAKAHGKIFSFLADPEALTQWEATPITPAEGFTTLPGVFSAEEVDEGSALLAACLPAHLPARMADLGAGWGWLSAQVLAREGVESLDLVEAEHSALECSKMNISDPRATHIWADATAFMPENRYSGIVMNPPFHTSREATPGLGQAFIRAAAKMLSLSGTLWLVFNRHLPYDEVLQASFHEVEDIVPPSGVSTRFRIVRGHRPVAGGQKSATSSAPRRVVARKRR
ncbi:methyltransferase [Thioclava sp. A2]|uniref:class I SAM-dependent methyltransferase n=1 Tax=Thioclava sp. FCG-A2 TaxID=3080562 RepID=UPI0029550797|nr:methyltransferase [Thioclava sp. A2]MDV7270300.1 methyltransferase [Thioclava sp. A2]